jgi:hypothetical protein
MKASHKTAQNDTYLLRLAMEERPACNDVPSLAHNH